MLYILALFFPGLAMIFAGRVASGIICILLQCTVIGWLPATLWAFFVVMEHNTGKHVDRAVTQVLRDGSR